MVTFQTDFIHVAAMVFQSVFPPSSGNTLGWNYNISI